MVFTELDHLAEETFRLLPVPGSAGDQQLTGLPEVVITCFNDRDVELFMQPDQDRFDPAPFFLQGVAILQVERQP